MSTADRIRFQISMPCSDEIEPLINLTEIETGDDTADGGS